MKTIARCALLTSLAVATVSPPAYADGVSVEAATKDQKKEAITHFRTGMKAFDAGQFDEAANSFQASLDIVASPNAYLMLARALAGAKKNTGAVKAYKAATVAANNAANKKKYEPTLNAATEELGQLRATLAEVSIEITGGDSTTVTLDGRELTPKELAGPTVVEPGSHTATATRADGTKVEESISVNPGDSATIELDISPPAVKPSRKVVKEEPTDNTHLRPYAYVAGGVGAAGLLTFMVFGALNNSKFSRLEEECPNGRCNGDRDDDISTGQTYQTIANVGLVFGVLGAAAGVTLYVLSESSKEDPQRASLRLKVRPQGLSLSGAF